MWRKMAKKTSFRCREFQTKTRATSTANSLKTQMREQPACFTKTRSSTSWEDWKIWTSRTLKGCTNPIPQMKVRKIRTETSQFLYKLPLRWLIVVRVLVETKICWIIWETTQIWLPFRFSRPQVLPKIAILWVDLKLFWKKRTRSKSQKWGKKKISMIEMSILGATTCLWNSCRLCKREELILCLPQIQTVWPWAITTSLIIEVADCT